MSYHEPTNLGESELDFERHPDILLVAEGSDQRVLAYNRAARAVFPPGLDPDENPMMADMSLGQQILDLSGQAFKTGVERVGESSTFHVLHADGRVREMSATFTLTPWHGEDGAVRGVIARGSSVTPVAVEPDPAIPHGGPAPRHVELDFVRSFQDALLPGDLPVIPGLDLAASYLLATEEESAGGDWFDAVQRPDGRVALVVGDVVGSGLAATAVMGQLRAVLHDRLLGAETLADALAALDRFSHVRPESHAATVCVVVLDPETGGFEYCTAGHPPPLVISPGGETRYLAASGARPLATRGEFLVARDRLEPDEMVLLYTDGIVERPGTTLTQSTVDLSRVAAETARDDGLAGASGPPAERVCRLALEHLVRHSGYADDITLMVAQRVPRIAPLHLRLPAVPTTIARARGKVRRWVESHDIRALDELAIQHSVGELVTNVVDHAYATQESTGEVEVEAHIEPTGHLVCAVRDTGQWRVTERSSGRGRGLALVRGLVDELELLHGPSGTTATIRHRLSRPALLLTALDDGDQPALLQVTPYGTRVDGDRLVVEGALDRENSDSLRAVLLRASRGRTAGLTLDLTGVTYLGSSAVQVLHEITLVDGAPLVLLAPAGSVAQHVLDVARIPHTTHVDGSAQT